ncbi:MAG: cation:proton antiporter [bacterium]|nr:cation:proton antiporter [bacterium]
MDTAFLAHLSWIFLLAGLAALVFIRLGQSALVGYLLLGALIGPHGLGLVTDPAAVEAFAGLGVLFLMFFLGLEFSVERFARVRRPVLWVGGLELAGNLLAGYGLAWLAGFGLLERLFLAGIMAMSSSAIAAKLLFELRRTASREAEVLMGVVVFEDFAAVILLAVLTAMAGAAVVKAGAVSLALLKVASFYAIALLLGPRLMAWLAPRLESVDSDEVFVALIFGLVLLASGVAALAGLAPAAGAFVLGMVLTQPGLVQRISARVAPLRDAFLILFFVTFAMLVDPRGAAGVLRLVAIAVPVSVATELVVTSGAAWLSGLRGRTAVAVGTGMIARGEYALIYAQVGAAAGVVSAELYNFTGLYVFAMTLLAPFFMRNARVLHSRMARLLPRWTRRAAARATARLRPILYRDDDGKDGQDVA